MQALHVPSVSIAVIRGDRIGLVEAFGDATPRTASRAGSSKLVAAVAALRLVQQKGELGLDIDVDSELVSLASSAGAVHARPRASRCAGC